VTDDLKAELTDGVLILTAPKNVKLLEENVRKIPITVGESSKQLKEGKEETVVDVEKKKETVAEK
jgi:hypothetical protein